MTAAARRVPLASLAQQARARENFGVNLRQNELAVKRAEAALAEALARRTQTAAPTRPQEIAQQEETVHRAEAALADQALRQPGPLAVEFVRAMRRLAERDTSCRTDGLDERVDGSTRSAQRQRSPDERVGGCSMRLCWRLWRGGGRCCAARC